VNGLQQWAAVQELYKKKIPKAQIARQLGMSRNTVKRLLKLKTEPQYSREHYPSKLDGYKELIFEWRCSPYEFNGTRIFRELKKRGYKGSIGPIYRYLEKTDEDIGLISSKASVRIETPVGDQAQFDWAEYDVEVNGRIRTVYCFSMILAACRKKAMCFSLKSDADAIYEAIQELFNQLGGVTRELLIDNPKALVIDNSPKCEEEIRYNPQALLLAVHLGTELNACPCYWPRKKGKVEKPFQYIEEQFIKGSAFVSMEELNRKGNEFIQEWNQEKHTTTQRIPDEFYETEEKQALLPLSKKHFRTKQLIPRIVSNDSLVSVEANKYSLPVKYVGKTVYYRIVYGFRIEIYDKQEKLIHAHEADDKKHETHRINNHYDEIATRTSTSIPQIRRDFTKVFSHGASYLECASRKFDQPTHHARRILELQDLYETDVLDRFIAYAVANNMMDIKSFKRLLKERFLEIAYTDENDNEDTTFSSNVDQETCFMSGSSIPDGILRECSYYENIGKEKAHEWASCK